MERNNPYDAFVASIGSIDEFDLRPLASIAARLHMYPESGASRAIVTVEMHYNDYFPPLSQGGPR